MKTEVIVLIVIIVVLLGYFIAQYSQILALRQRLRTAFALVNFQLKQRYDLIPALIRTARSYISQEDKTMQSLNRACNNAAIAAEAASTNPANVQLIYHLIDAEVRLKAALADFFELTEKSPNLNSDSRLIQQVGEITSTEKQIALSQQAFNDAVMNYNDFRDEFPVNIITMLFRFREAEFFQVEANELQNSTGFTRS